MTTDTMQVPQSGQEGDHVRDLQGRLQFLGFFEGQIDGFFAQSTEQAVQEYQREIGDSQTGAIEEASLTRLREETDLYQYHQATAENGGYAEHVAKRRQQQQRAQGGDQQQGQDQYGQEPQGQGGQPATQDYRQLSEDGRYYWDGYAWHPMDGQSQAPGTDQQGASGAGQQQTAAAQSADPPTSATTSDFGNGAGTFDLDPSMFDGDEWAGFREYLEQTLASEASPVGAAA